jgi:hypothetical protein
MICIILQNNELQNVDHVTIVSSARFRVLTVMSMKMLRRVVWWMLADVLEERTASILTRLKLNQSRYTL